MIFMVRQQKAFVCPDVDENHKVDARELEKAAKAFKAPPVKKTSQYRVPRGGTRGRWRLGKW